MPLGYFWLEIMILTYRLYMYFIVHFNFFLEDFVNYLYVQIYDIIIGFCSSYLRVGECKALHLSLLFPVLYNELCSVTGCVTVTRSTGESVTGMPFMAAVTITPSCHTDPLLQLVQWTQDGTRWHHATKLNVTSQRIHNSSVNNHTYAHTWPNKRRF